MQKTHFPFEIIIYDDASTDGTQDLIRKYADENPEIIFPIFQSQNQFSKGVRGIAANFTFPLARGKYIAVCEGDDYWIDPYKLQKQVDFMEGNDDFVLVGHPSQAIYEDQNRPPELYHNIKKDVLRMKDIIPSYQLQIASVMFRRFALNKINVSGIKGEHSLYILLAQYGKFKVLPDVMSVYRIHKNGASGRSTPEKAYPQQLEWVRNLKIVMGSSFFWGYHFLTSKIHTYYSVNYPEKVAHGKLFKCYNFMKYALLTMIFYPRNIRSVFRMLL